MFIFAADFFLEQWVGGAELTFGAVIHSARVPVNKILTSDVTPAVLEEHKDRFWIFGNYENLSDVCKIYAIKNLNYSVVEFDYKYCKYRTEHGHEVAEGPCDCPTTTRGKLAALFLAGSKVNFWMSEKQLEAWCDRFSPLESCNNFVLSSIFSDNSLEHILSLDTSKKNDNWIVLGSDSWIKGKEAAIEYAEQNNLEYEIIWGLGYEQVLQKLAESKGLIHLPLGYDTCPRMVIEAKLLGCDIITNELVQHQREEWFSLEKEEMVSYLRSRTSFFWEKISQVEESGLPPSENSTAEKNHFSIVIPAWNCEKWTATTLSSVLVQNYNNYTVYFIDDASDDSTAETALEIISRFPDEIQAKVKHTRNEENKKALHNICKAIDEADEDTVVVLLDGDDWLSSENVLLHLNQLYTDKAVWVTTGSYVESPGGKVVKSVRLPAHVWEMGVRKFREPPGHPNIFSHLRTFRKSLFQRVDLQDLLDHDGEYYKCTFDRALMYPMVEMAGPDHHRVIDKALYVYNRQNPLSVDRVDRENQLRIEQELRDKKPYERVRL